MHLVRCVNLPHKFYLIFHGHGVEWPGTTRLCPSVSATLSCEQNGKIFFPNFHYAFPLLSALFPLLSSVLQVKMPSPRPQVLYRLPSIVNRKSGMEAAPVLTRPAPVAVAQRVEGRNAVADHVRRINPDTLAGL